MLWGNGRPRSAREIAGGALLVVIAASAAALLIAWLAGASWPIRLSSAGLAETLRAWGGWSALASIVLMILHSFIPFPAELLALANGMLFGVVGGAAVTWTGAMLGAVLAFALARWLGRAFVVAVLPPRHRRGVDAWTAKEGTVALLLARLVPVIAFNLINYAAGLAAVPWWTFLWTTGLGILPMTVLMVAMGDGMVSGDLSLLVWLPATGLVSYLAWRRLRRIRRRHASRPREKEEGT